MKKLSILTCRGMLNSCVIRRRYNLWTKQNQHRKTKRRQSHNKQIPSVTIKDKAKGKVTKQQVKQLKKEHSGKDEGNIIIWEAEEAE